MNFLASYGDADEPSLTTLPNVDDLSRRAQGSSAASSTSANNSVVLAPPVHAAERAPLFSNPRAVSLNANIKADELWAPVSGAQHPLHRDALIAGEKNTLTGFVENHNMSLYQFSEQFEAFRKSGVADDPSGRGTVVAPKKVLDSDDVNAAAAAAASGGRKRRARGDVNGEFWGSWAPPEEEDDEVPVGVTAAALTDADAAAIDERLAANKRHALAKEQAHAVAATKAMLEKERSVFHGKKLTDYQGRTYMWPPTDAKPHDHECFIPKVPIHTWSGHTKGVNCIRFFPQYGHLLLSASMDNTIKIWDYYNDRRCLRTMYGHSKGVRDLCLAADGKTYLSSGLDKFIRLWDTETGACVSRFENPAVGYCVKFKPDNENEFLVASHDKQLYGWDARSNKIIQEYNEHLGPVNTITFIDNDRRFVSTSDDKKVLVWEYGIPVVIKHIADPTMHACNATAIRPEKDFVALQNLDNTITLYQATGEKFRMQPKKMFKGHVCAGYACGLEFSADGKFLASGDGNGRAFFWDFKSTRLFRTLRCHEGVCIALAWHPIDPSRVATCGWDGLIKLWD